MRRLNHPVYTPGNGPPQAPPPQGLWEQMGGDRILALSAAFYERLGTSSIRDMFPEDLKVASKNQGLFLIQALGGPDLYSQARGAPMMRRRHFPFLIDRAARDEWLRCFRETLGDGSDWNLEPDQARALMEWLTVFSSWMENHQS